MSRQVDTLSLNKRIVFLGGNVTKHLSLQQYVFLSSCPLLGNKIDNVLLICVTTSGIGVEIREHDHSTR